MYRRCSCHSSYLAEVPAPGAGSGQCLIHTTASLVSAATERMLVEFVKANRVDKARQQRDKSRTDGLTVTMVDRGSGI